MEVEYASEATFTAVLSLSDVGNCAIEANNDDGQFWYMVVDTNLGWTRIFEYGPIIPQKELMEDSCVCYFSRIEFDMKKIIKSIDSFLNKSRKGYMSITQAREISAGNALAQCKSIIEYMKSPEV